MRKLENKTNVQAPDTDYPFGRVRDKTSTIPGTPVDEEQFGDMHQFFEKLISISGITPNDLPENDYSGFQSIEALLTVINSELGKALVLSQIGTYTPNDLIILYGCKVTAVIPGTSSITEGAIFYNNYIYYVPANPSISSPANTLVFKIDSSDSVKFIYLSNGTTGSGIADYDATTVKSKSYTSLNGGGGVYLAIDNKTVHFSHQTGVGPYISGQLIYLIPSEFRTSLARFISVSASCYLAGGGAAQYNLTMPININLQNGEVRAGTDSPPGTDIVLFSTSYLRD